MYPDEMVSCHDGSWTYIEGFFGKAFFVRGEGVLSLRTDDIGPEQKDVLAFFRARGFRHVVGRAIAVHQGGLLIIIDCYCRGFAQLRRLSSGLAVRHC